MERALPSEGHHYVKTLGQCYQDLQQVVAYRSVALEVCCMEEEGEGHDTQPPPLQFDNNDLLTACDNDPLVPRVLFVFST